MLFCRQIGRGFVSRGTFSSSAITAATYATGERTFEYDPATLQLDTETLDGTFYAGRVLRRTYQDGTETNGLPGRNAGYSLLDSASSASPEPVERASPEPVERALSAVTYSYEPSGRLETVSDNTDSFAYAYVANSNLIDEIRVASRSFVGKKEYESNRDLMTRVHNQVSGKRLSRYDYTYDALGRRADRTQSGSAFAGKNKDSFAYNKRSEVTGSSSDVFTADAHNPTYTYDPIGNRRTASGGILASASATYTSNSLNQYSAITLDPEPVEGAPSAVNPTYDEDGNLTSGGGTWTYQWNNENRLKSATDGTTTLNFVYDYQGRLVRKTQSTENEQTENGATEEDFVYLYDNWNRIASFTLQTSQLTLHTSYLWGLDLSGSLQGAGGVGGLLKEGDLYPCYDANGNIIQKLNSSGETVMNVSYDPFGNVISGTLTGEYGFSTKPLVQGIDWYYYGFRYYDPVTGRWVNRDPIGEQGGVHLYAMVGNDPVGKWDYLGWKTCKEKITFVPVVESVKNIDVDLTWPSESEMPPPLGIIDINFLVDADVKGHAKCKKVKTDCCEEEKKTTSVTVSLTDVEFSFTVGAGPRLPKTVKRIRIMLKGANALKHSDEVLTAFSVKAGLDEACKLLF